MLNRYKSEFRLNRFPVVNKLIKCLSIYMFVKNNIGDISVKGYNDHSTTSKM